MPGAYILLRWRAYREQSPADPHLGLKSALYYFKTLALHILLIGAFCLLYGLFERYVRGEMVRLAIGLFLGGGVVYGSQAILIDKFTNSTQFPAVSRLFNGFNLLVTGLVAMGALVTFFVLVVQSNPAGQALKGTIALTMVYGAAVIAQGLLFLRRVRQAGG